MTIYNQLSLLDNFPHNPHYLNRYKQFVLDRCSRDAAPGLVGHHILPKAEIMFPEFADFRQHPWNRVWLTEHEHFIAHWFLWSAFKNQPMTFAFNLMANTSEGRITGRAYARLRDELSALLSHNNSVKQRGVSKTKEHAKNISAGLKGIAKTEEHCAALRKPKSKVVCRISDKKEMSMGGYLAWLRQSAPDYVSPTRGISRGKGVKKSPEWCDALKSSAQARVAAGVHPSHVKVSCIVTRKVYTVMSFTRYVLNKQC